MSPNLSSFLFLDSCFLIKKILYFFFRFELLGVVQLDSTTNDQYIRDKLNILVETDSRVFLLYSTRDDAKAIFKIAQEMNLTNTSFVWIVTQSIVSHSSISYSTYQHYPIGILGKFFFSTQIHIAILHRLTLFLSFSRYYFWHEWPRSTELSWQCHKGHGKRFGRFCEGFCQLECIPKIQLQLCHSGRFQSMARRNTFFWVNLNLPSCSNF